MLYLGILFYYLCKTYFDDNIAILKWTSTVLKSQKLYIFKLKLICKHNIESCSSISSAQLFEKLRKKHPKFRHQIVAIAGDCSQPNLGMSPQDRATIVREVTIVFHVAATVRFDEKLKLAVPINVRSTRDIFYLCREIPNLKVYLATIKKIICMIFWRCLLQQKSKG